VLKNYLIPGKPLLSLKPQTPQHKLIQHKSPEKYVSSKFLEQLQMATISVPDQFQIVKLFFVLDILCFYVPTRLMLHRKLVFVFMSGLD
jgi:hypothetical protein